MCDRQYMCQQPARLDITTLDINVHACTLECNIVFFPYLFINFNDHNNLGCNKLKSNKINGAFIPQDSSLARSLCSHCQTMSPISSLASKTKAWS